MSAPDSLLDLPTELVRIIVSYVHRHALPNTRLTCSFLYKIATEYYLYENLVLDSRCWGGHQKLLTGNDFFNDIVQHEGLIRGLKFICPNPRRRKCRKCQREAKGPRNLVKLFSTDNTSRFTNLTALRILSPSVFSSNNKSIVDLIKRFPDITELSIPITRSLIRRPDFQEAVLRLRCLKSLAFGVQWPIRVLDISDMDFSAIWEVVNANSESLRCLRADFCHYEFEDGNHLRRNLMSNNTNTDSTRMSHFADYIWQIIRSKTHGYFPIRKSDWPKRMNLRVLQLRTFQDERPSQIYKNPEFLQPDTLEIISLIVCRNAGEILNDLASKFANLRYLQFIGSITHVTNIEGVLRLLPTPLTALNIMMSSPDPRQFDYTCLERHEQSLRHLSFFHRRDPTNLLILNTLLAHKDHSRGADAMSSTKFTRLEELRLSVSLIKGGFENLTLPPKVRYIYIEDTGSEDFSSEDEREKAYSELVEAYVQKQIPLSEDSERCLEVVAVIPGSNDPSIQLETIFLTIERCATLNKKKEAGSCSVRPTVKVVSKDEVKRRFPDSCYVFDFGECPEAFQWKWIERYI
ncbi:hypothetical protein TWF281_000533 [Arthrobotrys megalospora]